MKILVTYQSKTGFTRKYAEWISTAVNGDLKDIKQIDNNTINNYDIVIHGGWIMGGMINGLNKIMAFKPKKLFVFGVGLTSEKEADISQIIEINKLDKIPFFYYEGGMNPKKMGFIGRTMVKLVTKKKLTYCDNADKKAIDDLVKMILNKNN